MLVTYIYSSSPSSLLFPPISTSKVSPAYRTVSGSLPEMSLLLLDTWYYPLKFWLLLGMMVHAFNTNTWETEAGAS